MLPGSASPATVAAWGSATKLCRPVGPEAASLGQLSALGVMGLLVLKV